jgi:hypothetical protein
MTRSKKTIPIVFVALMLCGLAACASSNSEVAAKLEVNEAGEYVFEDENAAKDEVICKRQRVNGSHVPQRICKTKSQIEEGHAEVLDSVGPLAPMAGDELQRVH